MPPSHAPIGRARSVGCMQQLGGRAARIQWSLETGAPQKFNQVAHSVFGQIPEQSLSRRKVTAIRFVARPRVQAARTSVESTTRRRIQATSGASVQTAARSVETTAKPRVEAATGTGVLPPPGPV